ncbi:oligosaccharide flippase family protein [Proteus mirabilis]|uniref:oligosaccharide flippase family protein n=1 Tax=Proteus mirabilis TaxID=584 RepID=UPI0025791D08|nr:oligosaccharide flippase family protein [Proteus mirabilis]MDM3842457.1 oligosaccharide flippase family protein [Proteus mirabilis]
MHIKIFIKNFLSMNAIYASSLLFSLITYPIVLTKIGFALWGNIALAIAITSVLTMFIEFGFNLTGIDKITKSKDIVTELYFFKSIFIVKLACYFIILASSLIIFIYSNIIDYVMLLSIILLPLSEVFQSAWYLQAKKKIHKVIWIYIIPKLFFGIIISFSINEKNYYHYIIYFFLSNFISNILVFSINYYYLLKNSQKNVHIKKNDIIILMKTSYPIMFSKFIGMFKDRVSFFVLGHYASSYQIGMFDLANKILQLLITPIYMAIILIFPSLKEYKKNINKKIFVGSLSSAVVSVIVIMFSLIIYQYTNFNISNELIKTIIVTLCNIPLLYTSSIIANVYFLGYREKYFSLTSALAFIIMLTSIIITLYVSEINSLTISICFLFSNIAEVLFRVIVIKNTKFKNE